MPYYRFYCEDRYGLKKAHGFEAEDDAAAMKAAEAWIRDTAHRSGPVEIWNQTRLVHKRPPHDS